MTLQTYLRHKTGFEIAMAVVLVTIAFLANVGVELFDAKREDAPVSAAEPWLLQGSSHIVILALLPLVVWFARLAPLRLQTIGTAFAAHALFNVVFSVLHVGAMYWIRVALYPSLVGHSYHWDRWWAEFGYEYLKDFRTYLLLLGMIYLYRFVLLRLQGEAGIVEDGERSDDVSPAIADRFVVKKLGREFLVRVDEIEWIESAGNYVNLHVAGKAYPLRETMTRIAEQLATRGFVRVHRQAIVNLDQVAEISAADGGDGTLRLSTGAVVPVSRRYRPSLKRAI
ncbi:MAG: LytTR family DNA-binding domain-containing protein [Pseudomonadota bacterium]